MGRPEVAVGREGAVGPWKTDIAYAVMQRVLNIELLCDPTQCQVRNVFLKVYHQLQVPAL